MPGPIHPRLWEVTLPAFRAAREAGLEAIAVKKHVSKVDVPEYRVNEHGWSLTTGNDLFGSGANSPPDWGYMFGLNDGVFSSVGYDNVPVLRDAAKEVREWASADPTFLNRISLLAYGEDDEVKRGEQVEFEYVQWVGKMVGRAESLGVESDDDVFDIYLAMERARFAEVLSGDLIVPIALTPLDLSEPMHVHEDVWLEPLDIPLQRARAVPHNNGVNGSSALVVAAATHAIVVRGISIDNSSPTMRKYRPEIDTSLVDLAIQALHITSQQTTGYAQVLVRPSDWSDGWTADLPAVWKIDTRHWYPDEFDDTGWNRAHPIVSSEALARMPKLYASLTVAKPNVHLAARRAIRSLMRNNDEDQTLDATIGIEALLLANGDREEITHRMATRAAAALSSEGMSPEIIFNLLKKVYAHRSAIVHGRVSKRADIVLGQFTYPAQEIAGLLLNLLLRNLLMTDEPWTPESLDTKILQSLLGSKDSQPASAAEPDDEQSRPVAD